MATDKTSEETPTPASAPAPSMQDFANMIGGAVTTAIEARNPRKVTIGEYMRRENAGRSVLKGEYYECGIHIAPRVLENKQIDLLNRLHRSGRYIDRIVEVVVSQDNGARTVSITWNNRTPDMRFENAKKWKDLTEMLELIVKAQDIETAEEEELMRERQERVNKATARAERTFGNNKAYNEAKERAGA